ncbi:MAG: DUF6262 family protein [Cyanobacteria bacterium J06558_2]
MSDKKLAGLNRVSQKKKQEALLKTEVAITKLRSSNQKITVRSVAKAAGVSVSYIYKYPELAYKIQQLREQQKYSLIKSDRQSTNTEQELQQEKAQLQQEVIELRELLDSQTIDQDSATALKLENTKLRTEIQQLKQELKRTRINLQEAREFILGETTKH